MGFREILGNEEREISHLKGIGILAEQALTAKQIDAAPASTFVQLAASSARCVQLWRGRNESKVGIELLKICEQFEHFSVGDNQMIDCVLSACINSRSRKCYLCRMKDKRKRKQTSPWNSRFDHSPQCQSWASSIIAHRALSRVHSPDYLDSCRRSIKLAGEIFADESRQCLSMIGGHVLPEEICQKIVRLAIFGDENALRDALLKKIGVAVYLIYESLLRMLAGDISESSCWSPLSFISRLHLLNTAIDEYCLNIKSGQKISRPLPGSYLINCPYAWPWVPLRRDKELVLQNVEEMHSILLQTTSTGLVSFCVTDNFVVTIETQNRRQKKNVDTVSVSDSGNNAGGINETEENSRSGSSSVADRVSLLNVFSQSTGQFLYTIALNELEYDYDSDDEPVRLFTNKEDEILVVIERENSLIPSIHQAKGVISLVIHDEKGKSKTSLLDKEFGQGSLLEFLNNEKASLSIWHPASTQGGALQRKEECYDLGAFKENHRNVVCPIDSETVQIKSKTGYVTRAVSPRIKPRSYRQYRSSLSTSRFYSINEPVSHFCEISHAGRLLRVSSSDGTLLLELNADALLYWEKHDSRILAADCYWPRILIVIEYEESIWAIDTEDTIAFQTVLTASVDSGSLCDIKVLEVSRSDPQEVCKECESLDNLVPNRVPDLGPLVSQLPIRLSNDRAIVVYSDNTISIHRL